MKNTILSARLIEISKALLQLDNYDPGDVMGYPDDLKLKSSMTLFSIVSEFAAAEYLQTADVKSIPAGEKQVVNDGREIAFLECHSETGGRESAAVSEQV